MHRESLSLMLLGVFVVQSDIVCPVLLHGIDTEPNATHQRNEQENYTRLVPEDNKTCRAGHAPRERMHHTAPQTKCGCHLPLLIN